MNKTAMYLTFLVEYELQKTAKKKSWDDRASTSALKTSGGVALGGLLSRGVGKGASDHLKGRQQDMAAIAASARRRSAGHKMPDSFHEALGSADTISKVHGNMSKAFSGMSEAGEDLMHGGLAAGGAMVAYKGGKAAYKAMKARKAKKKTEK